MQIWTNEASMGAVLPEYHFENGKLYSFEKGLDASHIAEIIDDVDDSKYIINIGSKKIKLDYYEAHQLFLMLLCDMTEREKMFNMKIKLVESKTIKEI